MVEKTSFCPIEHDHEEAVRLIPSDMFTCKGVVARIESHKIDNPSLDEWFVILNNREATCAREGWTDIEWLAHRLLSAEAMLPSCIEVNPKKRGGIPVIAGTRITAAEVLAEVADGERSLAQICQDFEMDEESVKTFVSALAIYLDRPFSAFGRLCQSSSSTRT